MTLKRFIPGLGTQILAAFAVGIFVGWLFPAFGETLDVLGRLFVRMVLMLIAPLVFSALIVGIVDFGRVSALASLGVKTFAFFFGVTALALGLGFLVADALQIGVGMAAAAGPGGAAQGFSWDLSGEAPFVLRIFPSSIVDAMARGDVLQIVVFAILFAIALAAVGPRAEPVVEFFRSLAEVMYKFTDYVMAIAPLGVFGSAAAVIAEQGAGALVVFAKLALALGIGLAVLLLVLFPALALLFRIPIGSLAGAVKDAVGVAFATASSAAALPEAMARLEQWGVPRRVVSFVLPAGLTFNLAGSTIFIGIAALFVVQMIGGTLSAGELAQLFAILFIATKGIPQVPRGSFVALAAGLASFGLPAEAIAGGVAILLGVDALLDMARTGMNVFGNCFTAALVARWDQSLAPGRGRAGFEPASGVGQPPGTVPETAATSGD